MSVVDINVDRARAARFARERGFPKRQVDDIEWKRARTNRKQAEKWSAIWEPLRAGEIVYLFGDRGIGKTFVACGLGIVWNETEHHAPQFGTAAYWRAHDLFRELIDFQQNRQDGSKSPIERAMRCGLLVLDELGEIKYSEFQRTELTTLIDRRYAERRPVLLIANQSPDDLSRLGFSTSALSRTQDGGRILHCKDWPNMRGNVA